MVVAKSASGGGEPNCLAESHSDDFDRGKSLWPTDFDGARLWGGSGKFLTISVSGSDFDSLSPSASSSELSTSRLEKFSMYSAAVMTAAPFLSMYSVAVIVISFADFALTRFGKLKFGRIGAGAGESASRVTTSTDFALTMGGTRTGIGSIESALGQRLWVSDTRGISMAVFARNGRGFTKTAAAAEDVGEWVRCREYPDCATAKSDSTIGRCFQRACF